MSTQRGSSGVLESYDAFLGHSSGGGGGAFLKSWREDGTIDVWLHPQAPPGVRWAHSFWELKKIKKKAKNEETEIEELRSYRWICHEREAILRRQRFRDDDIGRRADERSDSPIRRCGGIVGNGRREYPPEVCPMCLLIEWLRDQVRDERVSWTQTLFSWKCADGEEEIVSLGGFCGLFGRATNDYTKEQLDQLRRAHVERDESYLEAAGARCDYLLRVVDDGNPGEGCVIAPVADALGRKVQKAIKDRIEMSKGAFKPSETPFCMRWKYDDKKSFEDKYDVVPMIEAKPSDEVLDALEADPPSITELLALGNVATLRAQMEKHCALQGVPWDKFFGAAEQAEQAEGAKGPGDEPWDQERRARDQSKAEAPASVQAPAQPRPDPVVATVAAAHGTAPAQPPATSEAEPYECEVCNGPNSSATRCRHCGSEYDEVTGALTYDATKPVGPGNMPRVGQQAQAAPQAPAQPAAAAPAEAPPPAGREPARRRRKATA
jgi:hypothetical protein